VRWFFFSSQATLLARRDIAVSCMGKRPFCEGFRPVIRWVKGNGLDDEVTRTALGMATRLFGSQVDYCLCTNGMPAERVRRILSAASQPVEWWRQSPGDHPGLARRLKKAGCPPERFGYWWKWFPARVRPTAPEWIMDGDMVVVRAPSWFEKWREGTDCCRISQDDSKKCPDMYGNYQGLVSDKLRIYSGLASLPPRMDLSRAIESVLRDHPLSHPHDGCSDMCEQGVVALAFERLGAETFDLSEFPFGRAFEAEMDFGLLGDRGSAWGYHFGHAFRMENPHFNRLVALGTLPSFGEAELPDGFDWLGNTGQWGIPGWSIDRAGAGVILEAARGRRTVLELGTSRGHLSAMICAAGASLSTVDHVDRGAASNLEGLDAEVIVADALKFLSRETRLFDLVVVDLHDNSRRVWQRLLPLLEARIGSGGALALNNTRLDEIPEWKEETGVKWALESLAPRWITVARSESLPGVEVLTRA